MADHNRRSPSNLFLTVGTASMGRFLLNTARRFAYPFAPALSRGLGVPLTAVTAIIAANQFTGILGIFFAPLGDRLGYRIMLLGGMAALILGMLTGALWPVYLSVLVGLFLAGAGKSLFDPAILAWTGEKVPYNRRSMVVGIMEMSWATSSLVGVPVCGILIAHFGWKSPFWVLGAMGIIVFALLFKLLPAKHHVKKSYADLHIFRTLKMLMSKKITIGTMGFAFCISAANDVLFVVYGAWLEKDFHLNLAALGLATSIIGAAELSGEILTATLSDRIGPKKALIIGLFLSTTCYIMLPLSRHSLWLALAALFFVFITVEFTIVSSLSFFTEVFPHARASMMSVYFAAGSMGRVSGALIGGFVWIYGGIWAVGLVAAGISALALFFVIWGLEDFSK